MLPTLEVSSGSVIVARQFANVHQAIRLDRTKTMSHFLISHDTSTQIRYPPLPSQYIHTYVAEQEPWDGPY